jgi:hypothetical protein
MTRIATMLTGASLAFSTACGGDSPTAVDDMPASGGPGGASGGAAGSDIGGAGNAAQPDASATAGAAGAGMGADTDAADVVTPAACIEKAACLNGPDPGLCMGGVCSGCVDVSGDPGCVAAYGAGYLCIEGACVKAQCRTPSDCGNAGGKTCVNGSCVSSACHNDGECIDMASPVCDLPSGNCVSAAAACAAKAAGDSCAGAASKHLCCGATLSCRAIDCCTNAQCPQGQTCSAQGTCASVACPTVAGIGPYYVDATDPGTNGRTGSSSCPFKSITQALAFVTNPANPQNAAFNVTIVVRSAISEASEGVGAFPIYVGSRILIEGAEGAPTDPYVVVTVPDGRTGFIFNYPKAPASQAFGGITYLTITQTAPVIDATKQGYGIQVTATHPNAAEALTPAQSITIDHITVQKFLHGIHVDAGGYATLGPAITASGNYYGLYVGNGYATGDYGGRTDDPGHFDGNFFAGIYVDGASILQLVGSDLAADGGAAGKTITANRNRYGIRWKSNGAIPPSGSRNVIQRVEMNNNSAFDSTTGATSGAGLFLYAGGNPLVVRDSVMTNNYQAVHVAGDTNAANPQDLANIDLGSATTGHNTFSGVTNSALLCMSIAANITDDAHLLNIMNNKWNGRDCSTATLASDGGSSIWLKTASGSCDAKLDIGGINLAHAREHLNVKNCAVTQ